MLDPDLRNLTVANRVARIMGGLALALCALLVILFGPNVNTPIILAVGAFFFLIPVLNKRGWGNTGRILLSVVPVGITLVAAMLAKLHEQNFSDMLYYDSRFFIILLTIVPCLVFSTSEFIQLYGSLIFIFMILVLFDPIHEWYGIGYFQMGFTGRSYYYINYVTCITFFGIAAGAISLKRVVEKTERENNKFRQELLDSNKQLHELVKNIETQNEEIIAQSDELQASQEQLLQANLVIERQKQDLQLEVKQVNIDLVRANDELVKHNNELRQFSYTISHHLRGPIARLLGLTHIANMDQEVRSNEPAMMIIDRIKTAARELDHVVHDLNEIVDIRKEIYQVRERISFSEEWKIIKGLLQISDEMERSVFSVDFSSTGTIFSVRPMISSILFNLVSNAIKYQSLERSLKVTVKTFQEHEFTVIEVADNGMGIDLPRFGNDLFKMYKRFHIQQEGKGLGLYLIKSQAEFLKGFVKVDSHPDRGAVFRVYIKDSKS